MVDWIVEELDEAKDMVPVDRPAEEFGKITKGVCLAEKANLLLYANSKLHDPASSPSGPLYSYNKNTWLEVADAAKAVIDMTQYSLQPVNNWEDYTKIFLQPNSEMIFAKARNPNFEGTSAPSLDLTQSPCGWGGWSWNSPTQNVVDDYQMANGMDIDELGSGYDPSANSIYENRELRFYANILYNGAPFREREIEQFLPGGKDSGDGCGALEDVSATSYNLRKFLDEDLDFLSTNDSRAPWIFIRLSEMYLVYAEAQYNLGNEPLARMYVNMIRNRVNLPDILSSGDELFKDIQHERRIELMFEGHRFFDVRRWMIADVTENEDMIGLDWTKSGSGVLTYVSKTVQTRNWGDKLYYLPIPADEMQKSTLLDQNTGYN